MEQGPWEGIQEIVQFITSTLPMKYLGFPLITTRLLFVDCLPLIDKFRSRIQGWRSKYRSYAVRLQRVKSVLNSLASYWISAFSYLCLWG